MPCQNCERVEATNDALRDRCGSLQLINEGLRERAVERLNCEPNTDLNGRVAVLQLDRLYRENLELWATIQRLEEELRTATWPKCPACGETMNLRVFGPRVEPETGYVDGGEVLDCPSCGEVEEVPSAT